MPSWAYAKFLGAFFALCTLLVLPSWVPANFLGAFFAYVTFLSCLLGQMSQEGVPKKAM